MLFACEEQPDPRHKSQEFKLISKLLKEVGDLKPGDRTYLGFLGWAIAFVNKTYLQESEKLLKTSYGNYGKI
ncbi:MAG: hypothetical protein HC836_37880 [Richelia sp. RM2_1_2]|uniref:hypothetical protein n=1 Tax=Rivularia sp. UHCC 0363 TaxID=3110244 RepID=UPI00169706A2|nr:hypothetical protein [Rivularia sp. UHCC 0363]MEA5598779.1 hypothetical protein [Rivularia sp. UHCC 0363]NJO63752.1 hypothetical protein [Richelia sp. RM2_1_2]